MSFKIGIVTTTIREGRVGLDVANWVLDYASSTNSGKAKYEIVDLADFDLPVFGSKTATENQISEIGKWKTKMNEFDGFVFVVAEYNHSVTGAIKNATDYLKEEMFNKPASFVGYGGLGGSRAIEHLRLILAELQMPTTQKTVNLLLAVDFENYSKFKPAAHHASSLKTMVEQLELWTQAFSTVK